MGQWHVRPSLNCVKQLLESTRMFYFTYYKCYALTLLLSMFNIYTHTIKVSLMRNFGKGPMIFMKTRVSNIYDERFRVRCSSWWIRRSILAVDILEPGQIFYRYFNLKLCLLTIYYKRTKYYFTQSVKRLLHLLSFFFVQMKNRFKIFIVFKTIDIDSGIAIIGKVGP